VGRASSEALGWNVALYYSFISQFLGFIIHLNIQEIQIFQISLNRGPVLLLGPTPARRPVFSPTTPCQDPSLPLLRTTRISPVHRPPTPVGLVSLLPTTLRQLDPPPPFFSFS
jgi:hypothetical protein